MPRLDPPMRRALVLVHHRLVADLRRKNAEKMRQVYEAGKRRPLSAAS